MIFDSYHMLSSYILRCDKSYVINTHCVDIVYNIRTVSELLAGFKEAIEMKYPLLKGTDVAKMLNVTVRTLHLWAKDQHIPAYNFGTNQKAAWRFDSDELMEWIESRRSEGGFLSGS